MARSTHRQAETSPSAGEVVELPVLQPAARERSRDVDLEWFGHTTMQQALDRGLKAALAKMTAGLSPIALAAAYNDWALHLATAPGKRL